MEYFLTLRDAIDDIPATFIWNMDEISHSDWADAHQEVVYVPGDIDADHIPVPVSRAGKRVTLVACICLNASFMKPMVVISRRTVDEDLPLLGVSEWNCHMCYSESKPKNMGYFTGQIEFEYFTSRRLRPVSLGHALLARNADK
jgi:hypothetical protein